MAPALLPAPDASSFLVAAAVGTRIAQRARADERAAVVVQAHFRGWRYRAAFLSLVKTLHKRHGLRAHAKLLEWQRSRSGGEENPDTTSGASAGNERRLPMRNARVQIRFVQDLQNEVQHDKEHLEAELKRIATLQRRGVLSTTASNPKNLDYLFQGNAEAYTSESLLARKHLHADPDITHHIDLWWRYFKRDGHAQLFDVQEYTRMHVILERAVHGTKSNNKEKLIREAIEDWMEDSSCCTTMGYDDFFNAIFELADLWTDSVHKDEYIEFLDGALENCKKHEEELSDAFRQFIDDLTREARDRFLAEEFGKVSWKRNLIMIGDGLYVDQYGNILKMDSAGNFRLENGMVLYDHHGRPLFDHLGRPIHYVDDTEMSLACLMNKHGYVDSQGYVVDANGNRTKKSQKMKGSFHVAKDVIPHAPSHEQLFKRGFILSKDGKVMHRMDANGRALFDEYGRPLFDADGNPVRYGGPPPDDTPLVRGSDGRFYDENGRALFDEYGRPLFDADGNPVRYGGPPPDDTPLVRGSDGRFYDENGRALFDEYGRPLFDADGNPVRYGGPPPDDTPLVRGSDGRFYDENGRALFDEYGRPLFDADGNPVRYGGPPPDDTPLVRGSDGRYYDENGRALFDEYGRPLFDADGNPVRYGGPPPDDTPLVRGSDGRFYDENGRALFDEYGRALFDEYGRPLFDADGNPVRYGGPPPDDTPLVRGSDGRYYDEYGRALFDEYGRPLFDADGNPVRYGGPPPDDMPLVRGSDGRFYDRNGRALFDEYGRPLFDEYGRPLFDADGNPVTYENPPADDRKRHRHTKKKAKKTSKYKSGVNLNFDVERDCSPASLALGKYAKDEEASRKGVRSNGLSKQKQEKVRLHREMQLPAHLRAAQDNTSEADDKISLAPQAVPSLGNLPQIMNPSVGEDAPVSSQTDYASVPKLPPIDVPAMSARTEQTRGGGWAVRWERDRILSALRLSARGKEHAPPVLRTFDAGAAGSGFVWSGEAPSSVHLAPSPPPAPRASRLRGAVVPRRASARAPAPTASAIAPPSDGLVLSARASVGTNPLNALAQMPIRG